MAPTKKAAKPKKAAFNKENPNYSICEKLLGIIEIQILFVINSFLI